ncbi:MAG: NAD(P)H-binding protein [Marinobacter sp.]|uniref:NAD(P)H-binding protein n=1 Tax=Marinobacter sp. TaxID=50741 RepID=UPI00299F4D46|nr:NAD(P)H-binding protein [Marinobacter sp.]MDX1756066.1 NAD(P)H-binding protein [Marinobacter sp.]
MRVLLLGATGLTGHQCLKGLLATPEVERVVTLTRRPLALEHPRLTSAVADFDHLEASARHFEVDVILCCLGTTLKQAGSREAFRRVDYGYCLEAARMGKARGAKAFILMSAVGAAPRSPVFYNRVKGELERDIKALDYPYLSIYHPGLLLGDRAEHRRGESAMALVMPTLNRLLPGPLSKYRGVDSADVAQAMVNEIRELELPRDMTPRVLVRHYEDIMMLAHAAPVAQEA